MEKVRKNQWNVQRKMRQAQADVDPQCSKAYVYGAG